MDELIEISKDIKIIKEMLSEKENKETVEFNKEIKEVKISKEKRMEEIINKPTQEVK